MYHRSSSFLEWAQRSCVRPLSGDSRKPGPGLNEERRKMLVEGITFSRGFIVTYQFVLLVLLLAFAVWHWWAKFQRARRRWTPTRQGSHSTRLVDDGTKPVQAQDYEDNRASSSSSSTLEGTATPPYAAKAQREENESTPLLSSRPTKQRTLPARLASAVRSILLYQPPDISVVKKKLPSNATSLLILAFLGLNMFYVFYRVPFSLDLVFIFADRTSLVFVANLPLLYLLAAKNQPIKFLTGYSYENLNILHRRLGELLCFLGLAHGVGMFMVWYTVLRPLGLTLGSFLTERIILLGLGALVVYEAIYLTSLSSFRQWWYEVFLGMHVVLQAAALVLVFFHHHGGRPYVSIALGIFVVDRLVFRVFVKTLTVRAKLTVMEDGETVMVSTNWPVIRRYYQMCKMSFARKISSTFDRTTKCGWTATEHIFLTVPSLASKHILQAHPFTIASAAPVGEQEHAWFNLIIRAHDGFSRDLLHYAGKRSSAMVRLDGPYGSLHALEMVQDSDIAVMVAGGSGIAVGFPLVWSLLHSHRTDAEAGRRRQQVCLIWVVHESSHISWIGQQRLNELKEMGLHLVIPSPTSKAGRPDIGVLVRTTINDFTNEDIDDGKIGVVVSGPNSMNRDVRNSCAELVWDGRNVGVAIEQFGW